MGIHSVHSASSDDAQECRHHGKKDDHGKKHDHHGKKHEFPTTVKDGFVPGLYVVTSNIPGACTNPDGSLCTKKIHHCHEDFRTSGGSIVVPWAQFDKRDADGGGYFDWDFVDSQMKPWIDRGQVVNLLVWPAVQKKDQLFPNGGSATPDYIMNLPNMTYQCPDGSAQSGCRSEGIPLPKFWKPEVYQKYGQALKQFVAHYEDHPSVSYFRFGIGVGAESYPGNGCTTPDNYGMSTLIDQFDGATKEEKARNAYKGWTQYAVGRVRFFRQLNSKKPIVVTINSFSTWKGIDKTNFAHMIADAATKDLVIDGVELPKLGLGVQGATTNDVDKYKKGEQCYADWGKIFNDSKHLGVPLQIQTPLHSGCNGRPGPWQKHKECQQDRKNCGKRGVTNTGNLAELIDFSLSVGANSFELYPYEWLVANDKDFGSSPELNMHKAHGDAYGKALSKASNKELTK